MGLILVAATLLVYHRAWNGGFVWDDDAYITQNKLLTEPGGLWRTWFSLESPSQYFPLTYTTFWVERRIWGLNPTGYHLVNILLHAANALLLWRLLRRLDVPGAWLAAALFVLHPVQVESVAWITERKNVLCLFFQLLSLLCWLEFIGQAATKVIWRWCALALALFALALSSKTTACTLPAAMMLILWLRGKPMERRQWVSILPFIVLGLGMGLVAMWWERHHQGTQGKTFDISFLERVLIASRAIWFYAAKLIWPSHLTFSYPRWTINPADPLAYGWLVACAGAAGVLLALRRWIGRCLEVTALFYVATLSPLLGFIMLYTFRYSFVADHYQYIASIGPLALAAAGITLLLDRIRPSSAFLKPGCYGGLLLVLGTLTWQQSGMYKDAETLWRTTLERNPSSVLALYQLGNALLHQGHLEEAVTLYRRVLQIDPADEDVHYNLANALLRAGRVDEAITQYQAALQLKPRDPESHCNLGNALFQKGRIQEAISEFQQALAVRPDFADAQNNLGLAAWVLATSKDPSVRNVFQAIHLAEQVNQLCGGTNPMVLRTLSRAYADEGRYPEALAAARRGLSLAREQGNPGLARALEQQVDFCSARFNSTNP